MNKLKVTIAIVFICFSGYAQQVVMAHEHPGIAFTENVGQWNDAVLFRAGLDGGILFLEKDKLTFHFYDKYKFRKFHHANIKPNTLIDDQIKSHAFKVIFENCNNNPKIKKEKQGSFYENFFIDIDKNKWKGNVKNYHQIWINNLYNFIDYEILTSGNNVKYNFHVKPGANVSDIKLKYEGIDNIRLKKGVLIIKPEVNELFEQKPYAYQIINGTAMEVPCNFVLKNKIISYAFPKGYNKNYELIIDPLLIFAAQSGSTADNFGMTATYDSQGNLYSGGTIFDIGYPTTLGAYSTSFFGPTYYGNTDVVITKYNSNGTNLLYSTYFGGDRTETVHSLIVDGNDNLCFFGVTSSTNFPTTFDAYDDTYNGGVFSMFVNNGQRFINGTDIYVAKFNSGGNLLLGCTYIGGSGNDGINQTDAYNFYLVPPVPPATANVVVGEPRYDSLFSNYGDQCRGEIQLDAQNNIYVTSSTRSANFPTVNAFDNSLGGKQDGVIFKFNSNLSSLLYSSFIGGSSTDSGNGLVVEKNNEVYVTGGTCSNDFPYGLGGYQTNYQGGSADAYIIRIDAFGNSVLNGTFFGTSENDQSYFIQSDKQANIYIYGQSEGNIPILKSVNSPTVFNVPNTHQFISRFNKTLNTLNMSTVFGSNTTTSDISPAAFSVDKCSNIYLSGWGSNVLAPAGTLSGMPLLNATQSTTDGSDFYFMGLDSNAAALKYGSYFGGNISREHVDGGTSRFDPQGVIYQSVCAGCGGNDDFPVSLGAWPGTPGNPNYNSNCNNGVIKIDFQLILTVSTILTNTVTGCAPLTVNFTNATPGLSYIWYLSNTNTTAVIPNPVVTFTNPGTYSISLVVFNPLSCNIKDSATTFVTVLPIPSAPFTSTILPCTTTLTTTNTNTVVGLNTYLWDWGDSSPTSTLTSASHTYSTNGTYTIELTAIRNNGCIAKSSQTITAFDFTTSVSSASICFGNSGQLIASGGTSYSWTPATNLSNSIADAPIATPSVTSTYTVLIENNFYGFTCSQTLSTTVTVYPEIKSLFTFSVGICKNEVQFTDASIISPTNWQWDFGDATFSFIKNPFHTYHNVGTYTVTSTASNGFGCSGTSLTVLNLSGFAPFSIIEPITKCFSYFDTVKLKATGGTIYKWEPNIGLSNNTVSNPNCFINSTTVYSVTIMNLVGLDTCKTVLTTTVLVLPQSSSNITVTVSSASITAGQTITVTLIGTANNANISITPNVLITNLGNNEFSISPTKSGIYTLFITDINGCKTALKQFEVEIITNICNEGVVYLPTGFTPNGDGANDILYIRSNFIVEVYLTIYNRWGEKIFETNDIKNGWDGYYKGKKLDQGVYGYYMDFKCNNGKESFKKGNITLMN